MSIVADGEAPAWAQDMARQINVELDRATFPIQSTVARLPRPFPAGQTVFVSDEVGGSVLAFSDGTAWRRCTDRQEVS